MADGLLLYDGLKIQKYFPMQLNLLPLPRRHNQAGYGVIQGKRPFSASTSPRVVLVVLVGLALLAPSISSAQVSAVPPGAQRCADDFGTCNLPGDWSGGYLYYGANGKFVEIEVGPTAMELICHSDPLGIADPAPKVEKYCYLLAGTAPAQAAPVAPAVPNVEQAPQGSQNCAVDFAACTPPADGASLSNGKPYYGASGKTRGRILRRGVVTSAGPGQPSLDDSTAAMGSEGCEGRFVNGSLICQ